MEEHTTARNIRDENSIPWSELTPSNSVSHSPLGASKAKKPKEDGNQGEKQMNAKQLILASCAVMALSIGTVQAGPCDTGGKSTNLRDAGAGPTPGNTGQTTGTGSANTNQHPPTDTMNRATSDAATSSQDTQKQMQGQPTAAQQAQGAKASNPTADRGC
jgi:hypothetical protein